jgi:hypothetical protein
VSGRGGSSGCNGGNVTANGCSNIGGGGGAYGGGGGGVAGCCASTGGGASGAVRIIWPGGSGITRAFPSTNTGNL